MCMCHILVVPSTSDSISLLHTTVADNRPTVNMGVQVSLMLTAFPSGAYAGGEHPSHVWKFYFSSERDLLADFRRGRTILHSCHSNESLFSLTLYQYSFVWFGFGDF